MVSGDTANCYAGMVYMQEQLLGWRPVVLSWLNTLPASVSAVQKGEILGLCDWLLPPLLRASLKEIRQVLPMQEINLAVSCTKLFESLLSEWRDSPKVCLHLLYSIAIAVQTLCLVTQSVCVRGLQCLCTQCLV